MSYETAKYDTEHAHVSRHNREQLSPGNAYIVTERMPEGLERDALTFFKEAGIEIIKDVFKAVAHPEGKVSQFMLIHATNDDNAMSDTNSKMPSFHVHTYTADFAPEYAHITNPEIRSYVVKPNVKLGDFVNIVEDNTTHWDFGVINLCREGVGEAAYHKILYNPSFGFLADFVDNANDNQWQEFRANLITLIEPLNGSAAGGARIVYDEKIGANCFAISVYGGENLDRSGQNKQRYFENPEEPKAPAPK